MVVVFVAVVFILFVVHLVVDVLMVDVLVVDALVVVVLIVVVPRPRATSALYGIANSWASGRMARPHNARPPEQARRRQQGARGVGGVAGRGVGESGDPPRSPFVILYAWLP